MQNTNQIIKLMLIYVIKFRSYDINYRKIFRESPSQQRKMC